jgi:hypothetical protein
MSVCALEKKKKKEQKKDEKKGNTESMTHLAQHPHT